MYTSTPLESGIKKKVLTTVLIWDLNVSFIQVSLFFVWLAQWDTSDRTACEIRAAKAVTFLLLQFVNGFICKYCHCFNMHLNLFQ